MSTRDVMVGIVIAGCAWLGISATQAGPEDLARGERWEYAEFLVAEDGETVFVINEDAQIRFDPPDVKPPEFTLHGRHVRLTQSVKIIRMNQFGSRGWEFLSATRIEEGVLYLMRRKL